MAKKYEALFQPYKIGSCTIKNRFGVNPMFMPFLFDANGGYTPDGIEYFAQKAKGGFGLIIPGAFITDISVDLAQKNNAPVPLEHATDFMRTSIELIERVHTYGAKMFAQLAIGNGRNLPGCGSASEVPEFWDPNTLTHELTKDEIQAKIKHMVDSAVLCKASGYDGIEIHALHWGYMLDNFSMTLFNHRTDEYGGPLENRLRICKELVEGIKAACGQDYPVIMRLGLKSFTKDVGKGDITGKHEAGRTIEEAIEIGKLLEKWGYDGIDADVAIYEAYYYACPSVYVPEGFWMDLCKEFKKHLNIPVIMGGGRNNDPDLCDKIVSEGYADGVSFGRQSLADPSYPEKVRMGQTDKIRRCLACSVACLGGYLAGKNPSCAINPSVTRPLSYAVEPLAKKKKIIIVGGGVSGMEAARTATLRGHDVCLYEKDDQLGGHLIPGSNHSFKFEMRMLNEWYKRELAELKVPVVMGHEVTAEEIIASKPDAVILATGSSPAVLPIPGIDNPKAIGCEEFLRNETETGENVTVVGGGLTGCEIALDLAMQGKKVSVVEALDDILTAGSLVPIMTSKYLKDAFEEYGVNVLTGHRIQKITDDGAVISDKSGNVSTLAADKVILALGYKPNPSMLNAFIGTNIEVYQTGDANKVADIKTAVWEAYEIARSI